MVVTPTLTFKRDAHDHSVRYALSRSDSPMAVATYTYDSVPTDEKKAVPAEDELSAAFEQIEPTEDH